MLDFGRFRVLTFDCYGTLIAWETGLFSALKPILAAHGKELGDAKILELYGTLEAAAEHGEYLAYKDVLASVVCGFGRELGFEPAEAEIGSLARSIGNWPPFPDTANALLLLQDRFRLAIISNIDDDLFSLTAPKLGVPFDSVITAQQARCYKPCLEIFQLAQSRLRVQASEWLHVGQSIYHDVLPAQSLGISTVWVNRSSPRRGVGAVKPAAGTPNLEVPDLKTLADLAIQRS